MILGVDHVVLLVPNLSDAIVGAEAEGFTVIQGGQHSDGATKNALIAFADGSYIELLAFTTHEPPVGHYFADRAGRGPGLADIALQSDDIERDVADLQASGAGYPEPIELGRQLPDGGEIRWRMSLPRMTHPDKALPFLIRDVTDRGMRIPQTGNSIRHRHGAMGFGGATLLVSDVRSYALSLRAISSDDQPAPNTLEASDMTSLTVTIGDSGQWIRCVQLVPGSGENEQLERFGDALVSISLRTTIDGSTLPEEGDLLSMERLSGARMYLQRR